MQQPKTSYAKNGDVNIAYQVVGEGPLDLAFVFGYLSHLDLIWSNPESAAFLRRLASFSRLILFDKRGTGLSDPVPGVPTLEERMEDLHAVLGAVGSQRTALFGWSEGGPMSILFAIRCAGALAEDADSLGIELRAGFHTDECKLLEDDTGGA
jgi:pimeloyl-ACP methyl ester carboxylesterase